MAIVDPAGMFEFRRAVMAYVRFGFGVETVYVPPATMIGAGCEPATADVTRMSGGDPAAVTVCAKAALAQSARTAIAKKRTLRRGKA
jgi:hypothetical protein